MYVNAQMVNNEPDNMEKNAVEMKKIKKSSNISFIVYAVVLLFYALCFTIIAFFEDSNTLIYLLDIYLLKLSTLFCGLMANYKKNNTFAFTAIALQVTSTIMAHVSANITPDLGTGRSPNTAMLVFVALYCVMTIINNQKYEFLQTQPGFPHFNERRFNQDFDTRQRDIKDEFQQNYDRLKKTATDEMGDISKAIPNDLMSKKYIDDDMEMDSI